MRRYIIYVAQNEPLNEWENRYDVKHNLLQGWYHNSAYNLVGPDSGDCARMAEWLTN